MMMTCGVIQKSKSPRRGGVVSVRLPRGFAVVTRWMDAESQVVVLGKASRKSFQWPMIWCYPSLNQIDDLYTHPHTVHYIKIMIFALY